MSQIAPGIFSAVLPEREGVFLCVVWRGERPPKDSAVRVVSRRVAWDLCKHDLLCLARDLGTGGRVAERALRRVGL